MPRTATETDLGIIKVTTRGKVDTIRLTHNDLKVAVVDCQELSRLRVSINAKFFEFDEQQWKEVFDVYVKWKRKVMPGFKLPNFSGRASGGRRHPWRMRHFPPGENNQ